MDPSLSTRCILATCNLNQWANDFDGNLQRITESIIQAKLKGAKYRLGPELEICGYSMEDHFLELDTYMHCEESLAEILSSDLTDNILCDIGCPVMHNNVRYNCRVYCLNRKIILIRPKMYLADDGNYRERRYFTTWKLTNQVQDHKLSDILANATNQRVVPFGVAAISTKETILGSEMCEELWTGQAPHILMALAGVEIFTNGSGSHHQLRKLNTRIELICNATKKCGGVYLYSNHRGCDGTRLYFDGSSLIYANGELLAQASQFSLRDVEVITAVIDLNDVRSYRNGTASFQEQSSSFSAAFPTIQVHDFSLAVDRVSAAPPSLTLSVSPRLHSPEEECAFGPSCWLWDYLRRSRAGGFLLPLSGGADSASVATIIYTMCDMAVSEANLGNADVLTEIRRLTGTDGVPNPQELCSSILHTAYMSTENSSHATRSRAERLANAIGAYHVAFQIDLIVQAVLRVFSLLSGGREPRYEVAGGSGAEDLALQNIQARLRMVMAYLCAQLFPWLRNKRSFLLVLGSANVDESLRGYMTKYDCSSADLNPIGGICKTDLKRLLVWGSEKYSIPAIREIAEALPTAELRPLGEDKDEYTQLDEDEMGMSYAELGVFGRLRKVFRCGPVSMFTKLVETWSHLAPLLVAEKVKRFFTFYAINRHKMTTLTPAYHAENYSPDDNRFDLRQFLYNALWPRQFRMIDVIAAKRTPSSSSSS